MTNPEKGEVDLVINGTTYTLTLKTAALMAYQKHFSTPEKLADLEWLMTQAQSGSIEHVVALFWASLQKFHPAITFQDAVNLIDDAGGIEKLDASLLEAAQSTMPDKKDADELKEAVARPRKARSTHGTGGSGSSALAKSA
jgi:hypothetical protein